MTDEEEATTTEVQVTDDGRTHEVQEGGDDSSPGSSASPSPSSSSP